MRARVWVSQAKKRKAEEAEAKGKKNAKDAKPKVQKSVLSFFKKA